ncbi:MULTISPECIES: glycoside hydrolase family 15 protein [unclassified Mycobacterium]|uniref:glycoside hydrolase family 15 protein n=1 Tax=unclassified Mycobacterium TaxID=2642494 RepID=UPI0006DC241C|nr:MULTISPECIES: glycoside hydrolase family 15 protein [unclassified Mycobacterium]
MTGSAFPPIAELAFLADTETCALVAPGGNIEWLCLPRPDSPSVFGSLLGRNAGGCRLGPADAAVPTARRYLPGTLVLETTWHTSTGWLTVVDALIVGPWVEAERAPDYKRAPRDNRASHILVRLARCTHGRVDVEAVCEPVFSYGTVDAVWAWYGLGYHEAVTKAAESQPKLQVRSDLRLGIEDRRLEARHTLYAGEQTFLSVAWENANGPSNAAQADALIQATDCYWREWLGHGTFPDHPWRSHLQRSALTLKGLTYAPTGAMLAAATTSLPESPGGNRNWDYRYSWIRDSTFMLWSLYTLGLEREADDFFAFVADAAEQGDLQVLYGIAGERELEEHEINLPGYEGAQPVRVGNAAYCQRQHDVWGAIADSVWLHFKDCDDHLSARIWGLLVPQVDAALANWKEPDRGIWEVRGEPKHFTSSKLMCWVAADRGARLAERQSDSVRAARWAKAAKEIKADICKHGVDHRNVFTQYYGSEELDASLLLMPLVRFLPRNDKRVRATVDAIADELTDQGLVLRYRVETTDDGLDRQDESTFTICSFWLASAFAELGDSERARSLCEKLLAFAGPLGLYAEEINPTTGRHYGNFPQAFTHLALINALTKVINYDMDRPQHFVPIRS